MDAMIWYQLWRDLPDSVQYAIILSMSWSVLVIMDSVLMLVLNRWRRLNGWIMFVENAVLALCLDLADHAGSWLMPDTKIGIFAQILAFKIALSLVSDFAQNRRRCSSTREITLAAGVATLRGAGACIALAFLAYNHTYILRFLIDPFMLLTIFDVVICLALFQHLRWAPFIIPMENVILLATRMPAHEPPYFPASIAVLAYIFVKGIGSAAAIALDFRKGNRPVHRITIWQIAWAATRMTAFPVILTVLWWRY